MIRPCPETKQPHRPYRFLRRTARRAVPLVALLAAVTLLASACTGEAGQDEPRSEAAEQAAAMATEHAGDRPEATETATTEPALEVDGGPVIYAEVAGEDVTGYLARPADLDGPRPGVLVIHEWWGLNDNIRSMTRRLAGEGYVALAVDLYGGQVAESPERARELMSNVDEGRALDNLSQAREHLAQRLTATGDLDQKIGVIGWCFGGGWSLRTALAMPEEIDAAVIYYGHLVTDPDRLEALQAPILGIFGAEDRGIPVEQVRTFESALEELGKDARIHVYEGAGHAFANPSGTNHQPEAARDAWSKTVDFLSRHLTPASGSQSSAGSGAESGVAAGS